MTHAEVCDFCGCNSFDDDAVVTAFGELKDCDFLHAKRSEHAMLCLLSIAPVSSLCRLPLAGASKNNLLICTDFRT